MFKCDRKQSLGKTVNLRKKFDQKLDHKETKTHTEKDFVKKNDESIKKVKTGKQMAEKGKESKSVPTSGRLNCSKQTLTLQGQLLAIQTFLHRPQNR